MIQHVQSAQDQVPTNVLHVVLQETFIQMAQILTAVIIIVLSAMELKLIIARLARTHLKYSLVVIAFAPKDNVKLQITVVKLPQVSVLVQLYFNVTLTNTLIILNWPVNLVTPLVLHAVEAYQLTA